MLRFSKMHGLGNDFMVVDGISQRFEPTAGELMRLSDRKTGVGFDQLLLVERPTRKDTAFKYRIFNADGSEVSQCGNGARCFAKFVHDHALTDLKSFWVETNAGRIFLSILENGEVRVNMGVPRFAPEVIPLHVAEEQDQYPLDFEGTPYTFSAVEIGNPHAIFRVEDLATAPVDTLGPAMQDHTLFPERVNAGFMHIVSRDEINLRVFERGVGETQACGSGACAAVVAGCKLGVLDTRVKVNLPGGALTIEYPEIGEAVYLTGPSTTVYHGRLAMQRN